jgi:hypothetical protein
MIRNLVMLSLAAAGLVPAQNMNLDVKLGLWEITSVSQNSGMPSIDTSKMSPEMRERVEAAMKGRAGTGTPHTNRTCITKEKLQDNKMFDPQSAQNCKRTILTNSRTVAEVKIECQNEKYPINGTLRFEMTSRDTMKGLVKMSGGPMNMNTTMTGKWLSDSCGDVR